MINPGLFYIFGGCCLYFISDKLRSKVAILISSLTLVYIALLPAVVEGKEYLFLDFKLLLFSVDNISKILGLIFAVFGLASILYSVNTAARKYYFLSYIYIGSAVSILFVGDLFSFYICWELMTISSYFLIFNNQRPITQQTSYYYFIMHIIGAVSLLWGILLHYTATGSMLLTTITRGVPFVLLAVGIKLAFLGLHTWLPKNYASVPFYISVVLSAYTTKVGIYALYKLLGGGKLIAYLGLVSALGAVFLALRQVKIRKLLCYHLISQVGYMIVGIGLGSKIGITGGLLHLVNNILYKGLLFMIAGAVIYATGKEDLRKLGGLAAKLPVVTGLAVLASLAIAGVPFLNGYISKLLLKKGMTDSILEWGFYIAGIGTSLSFIKVLYFGFFRRGQTKCHQRPTWGMYIGMFLLAGGSLFIGLAPDLIVKEGFKLLKEIHYFSPHYLWVGVQPTLWAGVIFVLAREVVAPEAHSELGSDVYLYLGWGVDQLGSWLSSLHNGNLQRYLVWMVTVLLLLLVFPLG